MRFPATDPIAGPSRPAATFASPDGRSVDLDAGWLVRAALYADWPGRSFGISLDLAAFLAECQPADATQAAVIGAIRRQLAEHAETQAGMAAMAAALDRLSPDVRAAVLGYRDPASWRSDCPSGANVRSDPAPPVERPSEAATEAGDER